jgi:hypothetical protein
MKLLQEIRLRASAQGVLRASLSDLDGYSHVSLTFSMALVYVDQTGGVYLRIC